MFVRLQRTHEGQIQPFRPKEVTRHRSNFSGSNLPKPPFDLGRPENPSETEELFAEPIHLVVCALEAEIHLADDIIAGAAHFGRARRRLNETPQLLSNQP